MKLLWALLITIYIGLHLSQIYDIYIYEADYTITSSQRGLNAGKVKTFYKGVNWAENQSIQSFVNGVGPAKWPEDLKRHDKITKEKGSFEYCVNSECSKKPLLSTLTSMIFGPAILITLVLLALMLAFFRGLRENNKI